MVKAILLDCGGIMVAPVTGDWMLGPGYEKALGDAFMATHLQAFREARGKFLSLLPDANVVLQPQDEYEMFIAYYRATLGAIGLTLTEDALAHLAHAQVFRDDRYLIFDDVLPMLEAWRPHYKLGIVSDAPPSTRHIMDRAGITERLDGATYSCEIGVLKPNAAIYQSTLAQLGANPQEAIFVDDVPRNLLGAQALGIRAVQMHRRQMPQHFAMPPLWDGPVVHDMAELDAHIASLNRQ